MEEKKCLYDVLNVPRDATDEAIKKAYKKQALVLHPDKNPGDEDATRQFQLLQQAFEVLSDTHERAWYDAHREEILRGEEVGEGDEKSSASRATNINIFQYFSGAAYRGYGDGDKGFYSVFREVFNKLDDEERDRVYMAGGDEPRAAPSFGDSQSEWSTVRNFYNHWENFSSQRSFAFADKWRLSEAPNREIRRAMERENKKERNRAKKEFNDTVRSLVQFVRKRDRRVTKRQEEKAAAEAAQKAKAATAEKDRERQNAERRKQRESVLESELAYMDGMIEELKLNETTQSTQSEEYYCPICKKRFRSQAQWNNHEKSKKHRERVAALKKEVLADDEDLEEILPSAADVQQGASADDEQHRSADEQREPDGVELSNSEDGSAPVGQDESATVPEREGAVSGESDEAVEAQPTPEENYVPLNRGKEKKSKKKARAKMAKQLAAMTGLEGQGSEEDDTDHGGDRHSGDRNRHAQEQSEPDGVELSNSEDVSAPVGQDESATVPEREGAASGESDEAVVAQPTPEENYVPLHRGKEKKSKKKARAKMAKQLAAISRLEGQGSEEDDADDGGQRHSGDRNWPSQETPDLDGNGAEVLGVENGKPKPPTDQAPDTPAKDGTADPAIPTCNACKAEFSSRNKLFQHCEAEQHFQRAEEEPVRTTKRKGRRRRKE